MLVLTFGHSDRRSVHFFREPRVFLGAIILLGLTIRLILVLCVFRDVAAPTVDHNRFGWEMGWTARSIALAGALAGPSVTS